MPQVKDRDKKEQGIASLIFDSWKTWTKNGYGLAKDRDLPPILEEKVSKQSWDIWRDGYHAVARMFPKFKTPKKYILGFMLYFDRWVKSLVDRWRSRIAMILLIEELKRSSESLPQPEKPATQTEKPLRQVDSIAAGRGRRVEPESTLPDLPRLPRNASRGGYLDFKDAYREAVSMVTDANTHGELRSVKDVEAQGIARITCVWHAEVDACPRCAALDGQHERVWRRVAPNGPKLHEHCRCHLLYFPLFSLPGLVTYRFGA